MSALRFEDYEDLAKSLARFSWRMRVQKGEGGLTLDEVYSDVCMTWVACRDNFKEDTGASFKTYFWNACRYNNSGASRKALNQIGHESVRLDDKIGDDDDSSSLHDLIEDERVDVENEFSQRERLALATVKFPLLGKMLGLVMDPPSEFLDELRAAQAQEELGRQLGIYVPRAPTQLTLSVIADIMRLNWRQNLRLKEEMKRASEYLG